MLSTLIVYESKYGFTEMIAKKLALILGPAKYCRPSEFKGDSKKYDIVIICTPIYLESAHDNILQFVLKNADWIKQKKVILICTCLFENKADKYLKTLEDILGNSAALLTGIGGELTIDKLSKSDYDEIKQLCNSTGIEFKDYEMFSQAKFEEKVIHIKEIKNIGKNVMEEQKLKLYIEDFIRKHNTCSLATCHDENVRSTPIEYIFINQYLYILTEGGEKFLNLLVNPNVSICIYDAYKGMNELAGMQITGTADLVEIGSDEYISVLVEKGLKYDKVMSLPVALNLIRVNINKVEFLWSHFVKLGYAAKQIWKI